MAGGLGDLPAPLRARVTVFAPQVPPALPPPDADFFSDLPVEAHDVPGNPDTVSSGLILPTIEISGVPVAYVSTAVSVRDVTFELGRLRTDEAKFSMAV
jgi:hypothetical protein